MDFGSIGNMSGTLTSYMATPEGQDAIKKFLASPQGVAMLQNFAGTPDGKTTMASVLPQLLGGLNLPAGTKETVLSALPAQK